VVLTLVGTTFFASAALADCTDIDPASPDAPEMVDDQLAEQPSTPTSALPPAGSVMTPAPAMHPFTAILPSHLAEGAADEQPIGFISFCIRFVDQCRSEQDPVASVALTQDLRHTLAIINSKVNREIRPKTDKAHYGRVEYWTIPADGYGDCEDFALAKRKQLSDGGIPLSVLRIAVVVTPQHQRHAVLTIVTDGGDLVLDSLTNEIKSWDQTGYRWIERQSAEPMRWVSIRSNPLTIVGHDGNAAMARAH
jgi:predicted transglutaminase-like cysteine proteinase